MKKILVTIIAITFILSAKAQKTDTTKNPSTDTTIYASAEQLPEFPGGNHEFLKYIGRSIRYPVDARGVNKQGKVIVQMIVEKDGSVSGVKVLRKVFPSIDAEAIRVISASPKWKAGIQNGYPVRVVYTIPIIFNIDNRVYMPKN